MPFRRVVKLGGTSSPSDTFEKFNATVEAISELQAVPVVGGNLVTATVTPTGISVPHKLGRAFRGWCVVKNPSGADIVESSSQTDRAGFLDLKIKNESLFAGVESISWNDASSTLNTSNGSRLSMSLGGGSSVLRFPGPDAAYLISSTVYGENPSASVRTIDDLALRGSGDAHGTTAADISTPTEPATTTSLKWSVSAVAADLPYQVSTGERVYWLIDPAAGAGTAVYVYGASWTWAAMAEATVDLLVF